MNKIIETQNCVYFSSNLQKDSIKNDAFFNVSFLRVKMCFGDEYFFLFKNTISNLVFFWVCSVFWRVVCSTSQTDLNTAEFSIFFLNLKQFLWKCSDFNIHMYFFVQNVQKLIFFLANCATRVDGVSVCARCARIFDCVWIKKRNK